MMTQLAAQVLKNEHDRYWKNNPVYHRNREAPWSLRKATQFMWRWKETHPCADCNLYYHYFQMEFDHEPKLGKKYNLGTKGKYLSESDLRAEIAKCRVVCCNCHAIRTWCRLRGLGLGDPRTPQTGRHLPPGASLTPWPETGEGFKSTRLPGGSPYEPTTTQRSTHLGV